MATPQPNAYTVDALVALVVQTARAEPARWLSFSVPVVGFPAPVGVKSFGRWVQRVQCAHVVDGLPEARTLTELRTNLSALLAAIQKAVQ